MFGKTFFHHQLRVPFLMYSLLFTYEGILLLVADYQEFLGDWEMIQYFLREKHYLPYR